MLGGMLCRDIGALALLTLLVAGCSPTPLADSTTPWLQKENSPAWCIITPPLDYKAGQANSGPGIRVETDYTKVHVIPDAPWTEWLMCGCYDSSLKCNAARLHSRWEALFWKKSPYLIQQPAWQPRLSREIAASAMCISLEDPRMQGNESLARRIPWTGQK